jgi:hypothetical protein
MNISTQLVGTRIAQLEREAADERLARVASRARTSQHSAADTMRRPRPFAGVLGRILANG